MDPREELELLNKLCRALVMLGIGVTIRDAIPALLINTGVPGVPMRVIVHDSGQQFTWQESRLTHPTSDIPGAARRIAESVGQRNGTRDRA